MVMIPTFVYSAYRTTSNLTIKTHRKRTLASALTYRVSSTMLLMALSYLIVGQLVTSIELSLSFAILATVLFYFNDRAWERTDWGRRET